MADDFENLDRELLREVEEVAADVRVLRRLLRRSFEPDIARSGLTTPQIYALRELVKEDGLSLKALSGRIELSHSTVSGIVDRLERKGFVRRVPDSEDRRYIRIFLSDDVRKYVREEAPFRNRDPILKALTFASAEERSQVLRGVRTLRRLVEAAVSEGGEGRKTDDRGVGRRV